MKSRACLRLALFFGYFTNYLPLTCPYARTAPLAPAVEDVPVTGPAATQNPDEADDERFDAYSSRRRVIRVPPSNLQDVRPPPEAYAEAGMAGDASTPKIGTVVKDVLPGIHGKIQVRVTPSIVLLRSDAALMITLR